MNQFDPKELRQAFGTFMTGVTVVTTLSANHEPVGFTANSFTSVSIDPPLLLICIGKSLGCYPVFNACDHFAVNILAETQQDTSNLFAGFSGDRFSDVSWQADEFGSPLLNGATTHFSCGMFKQVDAGDHLVLFGEIKNFTSTGNEGLGYSNQGYFSLGLERAASEPPTSARSFRVGAIIESEGKILLQDSEAGLQLPSIEVESRIGSLAAIRDYLKAFNLDVEFGPVYSIFDDPKTAEYSVYLLATADENDDVALGNFVPIKSLPKTTLASDSLKTMLNRYSLEWKSGLFNLYVGDVKTGDIGSISMEFKGDGGS